MTRVDFYLLQDMDEAALYRFAARLASKALSAGKRVHMHTSGAAQSATLDELLWQYPQQRFLPHALLDAQGVASAPISIGNTNPNDQDDVLINLDNQAPSFFGRFDRVVEIVLGNQREAGRQRYKAYRDQGYPLDHHKMDDWDAYPQSTKS